MSDDPREQLRQRLAEKYAPLIAEMAVKVDKPNPSFTLADLKNERASAIYVERALDFLLGPARQSRVNDVQATQTHTRALEETDGESVQAQARKDIATHRRTH